MTEEKIRLQKYLAMANVASRRTAEEYITQGRVKVNGNVCDVLGTRRDLFPAQTTNRK